MAEFLLKKVLGDYYYLNLSPTNIKGQPPLKVGLSGALIIQYLHENMSEKEIALKLSEEFDATAGEIEDDVKSFIIGLERSNMIISSKDRLVKEV